MVVELILRQLGLDYRIRNGVIMVASEQDIQSQTEVRVYELPLGGIENGLSLAGELADLIPATIDIHSWQATPQAHGQAGYGGGGFGGGGFAAPGGGGGLGGESSGVGTIRVFRGTLVISQTPEVHQKIEKLLDDLSKTGALNPQRLQDLRAAEPPPGAGGYGSAGPGGARSPNTLSKEELEAMKRERMRTVSPGYGSDSSGGGSYGGRSEDRAGSLSPGGAR
jgi:hypothetical protein